MLDRDCIGRWMNYYQLSDYFRLFQDIKVSLVVKEDDIL